MRGALQSGRLAFGFAAGGLLFPCYLGATAELQAAGVLREETSVAGASAGSIIAVCLKSGLSLEAITAVMFDLVADCRAGGSFARLGPLLERTLRDALPSDAAQRASGRVHVAVTHLAPHLQP